jgi:RNase P/RNase MRP subunit p30
MRQRCADAVSYTKMIDLFIGEKDKEIEKKALELGFSEIFFCKIVEHVKEIDKNDKEKYDCYIVKTKDIEQFRRIIDKSANFISKLIVLGTTNVVNRIALENKRVFALLNPEYGREKDYLDSRDSGLNQVLCKIARDFNKKILISIDLLRDEKNLGRVLQNFKLCKKFGNETQIVNFVSDVSEMKRSFELKEIERVLLSKEHFERRFINPQ